MTSNLESPCAVKAPMFPITFYLKPLHVLGEQEAGRPRLLLRQSEPAHQIRIAGIRAYGIERRIANAEEDFIVFIGESLLQVFECLVTISQERKTYSDGCHVIFFGWHGEC